MTGRGAPPLHERGTRAVARSALVLFGRLPGRARRAAVRIVGRSFVAGAVGVLERDGHVLLVRTVYRPGWGLPGGMLSRREAPAATVVRELQEELGIEVEPTGSAATVIDIAQQRLDFVFPVRLVGDPGPVEPRSVEIAAVGWFPVGALPALQREAADALDALANPTSWPWVTANDDSDP